MRKCLTCKQEITDADIYPSHRVRVRPNCKACVRKNARLSYYRRRARGRELACDPIPEAVEHNAKALKALLGDMEGKNLVEADLKLSGCYLPVIGGLRFQRVGSKVFMRAILSERLTLNRDVSLTPISTMSLLLAERYAKVVYDGKD